METFTAVIVMKERQIKSYLMFLGSMLIFGTIGVFRRYIPVSSTLLAFMRGLLGSAALFIFVKLKRKKFSQKISFKVLLLLILSGGLIGLNWIFLFEAYNYTTIATATLCYYMQPTIVVLLSPILFKEYLGFKKGICVITSVIGMILVSGVFESESQNSSDAKGVAFGLASAVLYAVVVILNKKIPIDDAYKKTVIQLFSASVVLIPYLLLTENLISVKLSPTAIVLIIVLGIVHTGIAYAMYFASIPSLSAQSIAIMSYLDPVSALFISAVILAEGISLYGITGAVLIIGSAVISELSFKRKTKHT